MEVDTPEIKLVKVKFLLVCDDKRWDAEKVARSIEGDAKFLAPTIVQIETYSRDSQIVKAIDMAIHPQLRVASRSPT